MFIERKPGLNKQTNKQQNEEKDHELRMQKQ